MKKIIVLFLLSLSTFAFSNDVVVSKFTVDSIRISSSTGVTYVKPSTPIQKKNSTCGTSDFYAIHESSVSYNQIYSALLTAASSSKSVTIWVSTGSNDCLYGRQKITKLEVDF